MFKKNTFIQQRHITDDSKDIYYVPNDFYFK